MKDKGRGDREERKHGPEGQIKRGRNKLWARIQPDGR